MATLNVKPMRRRSFMRKNTGFSLIELLIASSLGGLIMLSLTHFFISNTRAAKKESRILVLHSSISEALRFIQDELRRAGQNDKEGNALIVPGSSRVIDIKENEFGFLFRSDGNYVYSSFRSDTRDKTLRYCTQLYESLPTTVVCNGYYSIFDNNQIKVTEFSINEVVSNGLEYVSITIDAQFSGHPEHVSLQTSVGSRAL